MIRTHLTVALTCAAVLLAAPAAFGKQSDAKKLRKGVTVDGILEHERALQRIASAHDGNRAATTDGYKASVATWQAGSGQLDIESASTGSISRSGH